MIKIPLQIICFIIMIFSMTVHSQEIQVNVNNYLQKISQAKQLSADDISQLIITKQHISSISNVHHIYFRQAKNGLEINGTESSIHVLENGRLLTEHLNFIQNLNQKSIGSYTPTLSAVEAVTHAASQLGYALSESLQVISTSKGVDYQSVISKGGISLSDIPVKLMLHKLENESIILVWDLSIQALNKTEWYSVRIDATTGQIIDKVNWMTSCNFTHEEGDHTHMTSDFVEESEVNETMLSVKSSNMSLTGSYEVVAMPIESPLYGGRSIEVNAAHTTASPFGWHDTDGIVGPEFTDTRGNNVNAYEAGDNYGYRPNGGPSLVFHFPFNPVYSNGDQSEDAAITNLYYWNNVIHDVTYMYGFDEASGNFQVNNYGNGGLGNDPVLAEAQSGQTCNAFFGTPGDGSSPGMYMFICNSRDGCFDNLVVMHEYGHGISNRLTGPSVNCLGNQEQMGEGWSDWYGLMLTMKSSDVADDARGIGTFLFGQGQGGPGIRTHRYTTNMAVNPHTYDDIKTEVAPHGVGSVWCAMLWELTWGLIDEYGFDDDFYDGTGGNNIALALVTEGMKFQPCSPGFVDGRDAILAADVALFGGANECIIWEAFAKRGLGFSASQGSSNSKFDGTEAFDTPFDVVNFTAPNDVCVSEGILTNQGGGIPTGGIYSGSGVTDNGDGLTFNFDPSVAGLGVHEITYTLTTSVCGGAPSSDSDTIEVLESLVVDCPADITIVLDTGTTYIVPDFLASGMIEAESNCNNTALTSVQTPIPGTELGVGTHTVEITISDAYGNSITCEFTLIIDATVSIEDEIFVNGIVLYPNPVSDALTILNNSGEMIISTTIIDISGKIIENLDSSSTNNEHIVYLKSLSAGIYFIQITTEKATLVKRIVKK